MMKITVIKRLLPVFSFYTSRNNSPISDEESWLMMINDDISNRITDKI